MGAESPYSFSAIIKAKHPVFISYSDVMHTLTRIMGEQLADIAEKLKLLDIHKSHVAYLSGPDLAVTKAENNDALEALLNETMFSRRISSAHYGLKVRLPSRICTVGCIVNLPLLWRGLGCHGRLRRICWLLSRTEGAMPKIRPRSVDSGRSKPNPLS